MVRPKAATDADGIDSTQLPSRSVVVFFLTSSTTIAASKADAKRCWDSARS